MPNLPDVLVEAAFTTDPLDTPSWTDISEYARSVSYSRGRHTGLEDVPASTCSIRLDNRDGRFDPQNTSGPYFGDLLPMRRIRLRATWDSVTYALWDGYIESYRQDYVGNFDAVTVLECVDGFKILSTMPVPSYPEYAEELERLLDPLWGYWPLDGRPSTRVIPGKKVKKRGRKLRGRRRGREVRSLDAGMAGMDLVVFGSPTFELEATDGPVMGEKSSHMDFPSGTNYLFHTCAGDDRPGAQNRIAVTCVFKYSTGVQGNGYLVRGPDVPGVPSESWWLGIPSVSGTRRVRWVVEHSDGTNTVCTASGLSLANAVWYHVLATWRGDTGVGQLFVNGVREAVVTSGAKTMRRGTGGQQFRIGLDSSNNSNNLLGQAEVAVSERIFDEDANLYEAQRLYEVQQGGFGPSSTDTNSGERIEEILASAGWTAGDSVTTGSGEPVGPQRMDGASYLDLIMAAAESGFVTSAGNSHYMLFMSKDGLVRYRNAGEDGASQGTFSDTGVGGLPYKDLTGTQNDDLLVFNVIEVNPADLDPVTVEDSASIAAHGPRKLSWDDTLHIEATDRDDFAARKLAMYKDPRPRIATMTLAPMGDENLWPQVLGRELNERITVIRHPPNAGTQTFDVRIHGMDVTIQPGEWDVKWHLDHFIH